MGEEGLSPGGHCRGVQHRGGVVLGPDTGLMGKENSIGADARPHRCRRPHGEGYGDAAHVGGRRG